MIESYVISVPSLYYRLENTFWKNFSDLKTIQPQLIEGVDGNEFELPMWWKVKEKGHAIGDDTNENAMWGLVQSYLNLFDTLIKNKVNKPFLILEDDSVQVDKKSFDENFTNFLNNLPSDWSVGYLSGYQIRNQSNQEKVNEYVSKNRGMYQTNAIVYKDYTILEKIKHEIINHTVREPIDIFFLRTYEKHNIPVYYSNKKLIFQYPYYTSIRKTPTIAGSSHEWFIS